MIFNKECHGAYGQAMVEKVHDGSVLLVPGFTEVGHVGPPPHVSIQVPLNVPARLLCDLGVLDGVLGPSLYVLLSGKNGKLAGLIALADNVLLVFDPFLQGLDPLILQVGDVLEPLLVSIIQESDALSHSLDASSLLTSKKDSRLDDPDFGKWILLFPFHSVGLPLLKSIVSSS